MSAQLIALRDYARRMAAGEHVRIPRTLDTAPNAIKVNDKSQVVVADEHDRPLWRQIADEIDTYLGTPNDIDGQEALL